MYTVVDASTPAADASTPAVSALASAVNALAPAVNALAPAVDVPHPPSDAPHLPSMFRTRRRCLTFAVCNTQIRRRISRKDCRRNEDQRLAHWTHQCVESCHRVRIPGRYDGVRLVFACYKDVGSMTKVVEDVMTIATRHQVPNGPGDGPSETRNKSHF